MVIWKEGKMRKLIMLSFVFLFVIFSSATCLAADYVVDFFEISSRTTDGEDPKTYIWFLVRDNEVFGSGLKDLVDHVDISINDGDPVSFDPTFSTWIHSEFRDVEWFVNIGTEYEIIFPESPHPEGDYHYTIHFNDGATLSDTIFFPAGVSADEWPPVTITSVEMDETTGELTIDWVVPDPSPYPLDQQIQIRIDCYGKKGHWKYLRIKFNLPLNLDAFTFSPRLADLLNSTGAEYFDIHIRVYTPDHLNASLTNRQVYAIDGYKIELKRRDLWSRHNKRYIR